MSLMLTVVLRADARRIPLADDSVQCVVTSPPYWGLRDYGVPGQLGLEPTPEEYVASMVQVFREVRRVLRDDGVCWVNLGDSYAAGGQGGGGSFMNERGQSAWGHRANKKGWRSAPPGLKAKDLCGIPWMVAFALRTDGWYLRSDIIWSKPNPMPESVTDRPTKAHEYIFLLTKSARYFYDAEAVKEPSRYPDDNRAACETAYSEYCKHNARAMNPATAKTYPTRSRRSVWHIPTQPYGEAHFATYPEALVEPCIKAGSRKGDIVLDPFNGSGTTGAVAVRFGRRYVGLELNPQYIDMAQRRISKAAKPATYRDDRAGDAPLFGVGA